MSAQNLNGRHAETLCGATTAATQPAAWACYVRASRVSTGFDWWGDIACRARIKSQKLTAHPPSLGQRRCAWSTAARETRGPCRAGWKYNCRMAAGQRFATTSSMMLPPPWSAARWVGPSFWACRLQGLSFCCNFCDDHHFSSSLPLQLGLSSAGFAVGNAAFGEGTGPIAWDGVKCTGSEATIQQCRRSPTIDCASSMLQVGHDWWCCAAAFGECAVVPSCTHNRHLCHLMQARTVRMWAWSAAAMIQGSRPRVRCALGPGGAL